VALALYRKYRPRTFAEVIGQEHVTEPLSQALRSGRLHHAYLFSGPRGCGKTSSARILARSLNCEQGPTPEPCGVCASCRSLANDGSGSIDVIEIDAASHGGVEDARDLREKAFFAPASSRYKIYVIDEAHMVSPAGFNALLKLVEEPPDYVKFIFATTEPEKVLGTIKSRTHHYPFRLIPPAVLRPYLQQLTEAEGVHVEPAVLPLVVRAGGGSARDTLSVLDQLIAGAGPDGVTYARAVSLLGVTDVALIDEMCDALAAGDGAAAYSTIDRVAEAGHDARRFASDLLERFRDLIILQQVPDAVTKGLIDGPVDQLDAMSAQATRLGPATLSRCADIVHNGLVEMRGTTAPRLLLELITARMLLPGADDSAGALLQRLERMERRLTLSGDSTDDSVRPEQPTPTPAASAPHGGTSSGGVSSGGASGGGSGISAARAAAAAAGRRAEAPTSGTAVAGGQASSGPDGVGTSGQGSSGPGGSNPGVSAMQADPPAEQDGPAAEQAGPAAEQAGSSVEQAGPLAVQTGPAAGSAPEPQPSGVSATDQVWVDDELVEPDDDGVADGWDDEPVGAPGASGQAAAERPSEPEPAALPSTNGSRQPAAQARQDSRQPAPQARRAEPAGVLPDAPEEPGAAMSGVPGQLSAAAIREVWPEIVTAVGRQSKKVAALASGATVRELEGETVVLTFRFPAHAKMVAADPDLIVNALYEAVGGRWQIRCEVAGEAGGALAQGGPAASTPARSAPAQKAPARPAASAPARSREVVTPAASTGGDDDWPEPARPGGLAAASDREPDRDAAADDGSEARPGGQAADRPGDSPGSAGRSGDPAGAAGRPGDSAGVAGRPGQSAGSGGHPGDSRDAAGRSSDFARADGVPPAAQFDPAGVSGSGLRPAHSDERSGASNGGAVGGIAAARAAAAGARNATAARQGVTKPGAATPENAQPGAGQPQAARLESARPDNGRPQAARPDAVRPEAARSAGAQSGASGPSMSGPGAARPGAGRSDAWSDGSPAEEPPYDPEYDGPPRGGAAAAYEGFDPGDEPLDDLIDEKTARQSSEQQAMQLLQDAFGAEKIGEV
jgi:DNA polymerase-3 subunit gamma/tau